MRFVCRVCGNTSYIHNYDNYYCESCTVEFRDIDLFTLPSVNIKLLSEDGIIPTRAKEGDVGYDIYSSENKLIQNGCVELIKTDIAIELPINTEAQIRSRSGMGKKGIMVANQPGTIDTGYRGMCGVLLYNSTNAYYSIKKGDRIAQMLITTKMPYEFIEVSVLSNTDRGTGGFESTGK